MMTSQTLLWVKNVPQGGKYRLKKCSRQIYVGSAEAKDRHVVNMFLHCCGLQPGDLK